MKVTMTKVFRGPWEKKLMQLQGEGSSVGLDEQLFLKGENF